MSGELERLAKALVEFRKARGITEGELARRTGLSRATIRCHERGGGPAPTPLVARRFEDVLGWTRGSIPTGAAPLPTDGDSPPDSGVPTG